MFTSEEVNILLEALDAWEKAPQAGSIVVSMLGAAMIRDDVEAKRFTQDISSKTEQKTLSRKRKSIFLKAKLVQMAEEAVANELFNGGE